MFLIKSFCSNKFIKNKHLPFTLGEILTLIFIVFLSVALTLNSQQERYLFKTLSDNTQKQAISAFNHIETLLTQLETKIEKPKMPKIEIHFIAQKIKELETTMQNLNFRAEITSSQLNTIIDNQKIIHNSKAIQPNLLSKAIKKSRALSHKLVMKPGSLPFKVVSIDIWNGHPMVTIKKDTEFSLMEVNESDSGWILTKIDFDTSIATFKNHHQQCLTIKI